jgi:putative DNA methylase
MAWDFVEVNPFSSASGSFFNQIEYLTNVIERSPRQVLAARVEQRDAMDVASLGQGFLTSTDPPYYDNIDYADLSDFFYVWLRRTLQLVYPDLFQTLLVPKVQELVATPYRFDGDREAASQHFRNGLTRVLDGICKNNTPSYPATIIYAFKQVEDDDAVGRASTGWESFLQSVVDVGFQITATWPLRTELTGNLKGKMNALASSVVLACRPRERNAKTTTRKELISTLRSQLPDALRALQRGSIAPVDLAQAAIGPGMAVYSSYSAIIEADGSAMSVRTALGLINQALDE